MLSVLSGLGCKAWLHAPWVVQIKTHLAASVLPLPLEQVLIDLAFADVLLLPAAWPRMQVSVVVCFGDGICCLLCSISHSLFDVLHTLVMILV